MNVCTPDGDAGALRYYQYFCATELASTFIIINRMLTIFTLISIYIAQLSAVSDVLVLFVLCVSDKQHTHMGRCNIMLREPAISNFRSLGGLAVL